VPLDVGVGVRAVRRDPRGRYGVAYGITDLERENLTSEKENVSSGRVHPTSSTPGFVAISPGSATAVKALLFNL
jgi:hypothetical protein